MDDEPEDQTASGPPDAVWLSAEEQGCMRSLTDSEEEELENNRLAAANE